MQAQGGDALNRRAFWIAAVLTLLADLGSKALVYAHLRHLGARSDPLLAPVVHLTWHLNRGGVWGIGNGYNPLLIALTALILPAVVAMAYACRVERAPYFALGMLLGGAAANLYDRMIHQGVRDFIDLQWNGRNIYPIFNVADIAIVLGVFLYIGWSVFLSPAEKPEDGGEAPAAEPPPAEDPAP